MLIEIAHAIHNEEHLFAIQSDGINGTHESNSNDSIDIIGFTHTFGRINAWQHTQNANAMPLYFGTHTHARSPWIDIFSAVWFRHQNFSQIDQRQKTWQTWLDWFKRGSWGPLLFISNGERQKIFQSRFWFSIHVWQGAIIGIETNHWTNCHCRGTHTHILIYLKRNCLILRISNEMIAMELTKWNDKWYSCYFSSSEWNNGNMFVRFWMATFIFRIRVCFQ